MILSSAGGTVDDDIVIIIDEFRDLTVHFILCGAEAINGGREGSVIRG
jgi:hypothetical protein